MKTKTIKVFGKNLISTYHHIIMSLPSDSMSAPLNSLSIECITNQPEKMINGTYSIDTAKYLLSNNSGRCDVFIYHDTDNNTIGTLSVMYRGGDDIEYKIRNIDAFIYNVYTEEKYRGNGYAKEMICLLMKYLDGKSQFINEVYLAVSTNNSSAIRAYEKAGFIKRSESSFIRILKINIPYKVL